MIIHNRWTGGKTQLHIPPLPSEYKGISGALLSSFIFEQKVGEEAALFLFDDPQFARKLGTLNPFDLKALTGMVRTSAGMIAYILWVVSSLRGHVVDYEHLLNPFDLGTIHLISGVAQQTHLKVLIVDSYSSQVVGFFEFDNTFGMGKFAVGIAQTVGNEPVVDFSATQVAFRKEYSLKEIKGLRT